jgi:hypothetical protein
VAVQDHSDFLDPIEFCSELLDIHTNILGEDRWTEGSGQMIFDEYFPVLLDRDLVDEMHFCNWKTDLRVNNFLKFSVDFINGYQLVLSPTVICRRCDLYVQMLLIMGTTDQSELV